MSLMRVVEKHSSTSSILGNKIGTNQKHSALTSLCWPIAHTDLSDILIFLKEIMQ